VSLPFTVYLDRELHVMHSDSGCPGLNMPRKYGYMLVVNVGTIQEARDLDGRYKPCDRCRKKQATVPTKKPYRRRQ
jgi:hypothetical protein